MARVELLMLQLVAAAAPDLPGDGRPADQRASVPLAEADQVVQKLAEQTELKAGPEADLSLEARSRHH